MIINTADYLALDDDEFDVNEAATHLRDMKQELAYHIEISKVLDKLEKRIKKHMVTTGEIPNVEGIEARIMPKKPQLRIRPGQLPALYAYLQGAEIPEEDLDRYFHMVSPNPAISLKVE